MTREPHIIELIRTDDAIYARIWNNGELYRARTCSDAFSKPTVEAEVSSFPTLEAFRRHADFQWRKVK